MKIFISVDIEGVAGVVTPQEGRPGNPEYEQARRLMTAEANAAIGGAFDGGATAVLVNDSHGPMVNLLPDQLDPRAELIRGNIKPNGMFAGMDSSFAGAMCVGYHAAAGDFGVLAHTYSFVFTQIRLNGKPASEAMLYGAYAGTMGVPVILLSGDDVTEQTCGDLFPGAQLVRVKVALGQRSARSLAPSVACARVREAAAAAVRNCGSIAPFVVAGPCGVEFDFASQTYADLCSRAPTARRLGPRTVAFDCAGVADAIGWTTVCAVMALYVS
jgi:D-amino peptidase